jgi:hypothetical protein
MLVASFFPIRKIRVMATNPIIGKNATHQIAKLPILFESSSPNSSTPRLTQTQER